MRESAARMKKILSYLPVQCLIAAIPAIFSILSGSGCTTLVAKSGDAKIVTHWQLEHSEGREAYYLELPPVSLAVAGTNKFKVRNLPIYLAGKLAYSLSMKVLHRETVRSDPPAWKETVVTIILRRLDGTEAFKQIVPLWTTPHSSWEGVDYSADWGLGDDHPAPVTDPDYDIVLIVDHPSPRRIDRVFLKGYAYIQKR